VSVAGICCDDTRPVADISIAAAVGTVQVRSLIEPIRKIIARVRGHFIQGKATDVVIKDRLLEVEIVTNGRREHIYVP
jgi:hypothetical protein